MTHAIDELFKTVSSRKGGDADTSYTAQLLARGTSVIARKVGEEAVETVVEALAGSKRGLTAESADLLYHLLVLWVDAGLDPQEVWDELSRRAGTSGLTEKAGRRRDASVGEE
jgi:phosphoribosyl-ATP pyrophosphohydrolase